MRQSVIFLTLFGLFGYIAAKYPSDLPRCHFGDTDCLRKVIEEYMSKLKNGHHDLGLISIDPLQVDEVDIDQGNRNPVKIKLKFHDLKCYGMSTTTIEKVVGFQKDPSKSKFEIHAKMRRVSIIGQYKSRGNILFVPIFSSGTANLTLENIEANFKFIPRVEIKEGKKHLRISVLILHFDMERLWMYYENLLNGDHLLSETTSKFANDNWRLILREIKPVLRKAVAAIYKAIAQPIFMKYPYEDLFLPDNE